MTVPGYVDTAVVLRRVPALTPEKLSVILWGVRGVAQSG